MRLSKAILLITILFVAGNLAGAMHYTLERGVDFGSKGLGHVLPLSDGKYVSFSLHDVDVFSVESDSLQFYQRLYSTQYYVDSKLCGVDTLLAITMQNRLDMYVYDQALGLRLVYEYPMASDDSLSYSNSAVIAGNGYVISSVYVNSGNQNTNNCQSIYSLNGTDTPALISRMYCSYEARFSRVEQVNQEYYYFGYDGRIYASSDLTNQPTQVTCSDLEGHIVIRSKVLEGSIYIISTDEASTAWLSKLGNVNNGNIDTDWMISLGNTPYPSFTELMNGYVFIFSYSIDDLTYIKKYAFSDSLQWQYVSSRSMPGDDYQLLPYNDGYVLFGYTSVRLLNSGLSTVVSLLAGEDTWWCDQVLLNRYLLLWNDQSWDHKLFDIENGQFLDQWFTGDYYKHTFRYGDNKLLFFGSRIEVATLDDHGISNYMTFPNDNEWYYGSVFDDQIVLFGDTGNVRKIYLYTIEADAAVQLSSMVVSQSVLAMQFYDTNHFAVIMVTGASTLSLKLYRIEEDNTFSLIGSYPATSQSIFVFGNILTAYATNGLVLDVS